MGFVHTYTAGDIKKQISSISGLSGVAARIKKLLAAGQDEHASVDELLNIIAADNTLSQSVLRVANTTAFGHPGQITDINQAVLFLGLDRIKFLAAGMTAMGFFQSHRTTYADNLWIHGYEVGFLASALSARIQNTKPGICFLAGLLHDVGRLVFYSINTDAVQKTDAGDEMLEKEKSAFGCTHSEAGAWFAEATAMPGEIVLAIGLHHSPSAARKDRETVCVVALAEALSKKFTNRPEDDGTWSDEYKSLLDEFSLSESFIQSLSDRLAAARPEIESVFFAN